MIEQTGYAVGVIKAKLFQRGFNLVLKAVRTISVKKNLLTAYTIRESSNLRDVGLLTIEAVDFENIKISLLNLSENIECNSWVVFIGNRNTTYHEIMEMCQDQATEIAEVINKYYQMTYGASVI